MDIESGEQYGLGVRTGARDKGYPGCPRGAAPGAGPGNVIT